MTTIFNCKIVLNITQGFGDIVLNNIKETCIPDLINQGLNGHGKVINSNYSWVSGILTHDLYLDYQIEINTYRLIKFLQNKWISKVLKYSYFDKSIVSSKLQSTIKKKLADELNGKGFVVILKEINVNY
jgi:hypothetical protein